MQKKNLISGKMVSNWREFCIQQNGQKNKHVLVNVSIINHSNRVIIVEVLQMIDWLIIYHQSPYPLKVAAASLRDYYYAPVITDRGSIPEVVGDRGLYVPYGDPQKTAHSIQEACEQSWKLGTMAREHILSKFPIKNRKFQLLDILEKTYSN